MTLLDEYEIKARYIPAILSAIPLIILSSFVKNEAWEAMFKNISWFMIAENVSFALIIIFFIINIQRFVGKYIFEKLTFKNEIDFPTTTFLLNSDKTFSKEFKNLIRQKIENQFQIKLVDWQSDQSDEEAKKIIKDAVGMVRNYVGKGTFTFQTNVEYGFMRNLIAGSIWALIGSGINLYYYIPKNDITGIVINTLIFIIFLTLLILHRKILKDLGSTYARILFTEFLATEKKD